MSKKQKENQEQEDNSRDLPKEYLDLSRPKQTARNNKKESQEDDSDS